MNITFYPSRFILEKSFSGSTTLAQLFLIASWLINEGILLENVPDNQQMQATFHFFEALDKKIVYTNRNSLYLKPSKNIYKEQIVIDINHNLSTLLFLLPVSLQLSKQVIFQYGEKMDDSFLYLYEQFTKDCNLSIQKRNQQIICSGSISFDYYEIEDTTPFEFFMGLIINALYQKKATTIKIINSHIHQDERMMGVRILKHFGFDITNEENIFYIHNTSNVQWDYLSIEADYIYAANYFALACLNGSLLSYQFQKNSIQSHKIILDYLKSMGGNIKFIKEDGQEKLYIANNALLEKGVAKQLRARDFDLRECIDFVCILMVVASYSNGISTFNHLEQIDERNRQKVFKMIEILKLLQVNIKEEHSTIYIKGKKDYFNKITLPSLTDTQIIMAISVFSMLNKGEIKLLEIENVDLLESHFFDYLISGSKPNAIQMD